MDAEGFRLKKSGFVKSLAPIAAKSTKRPTKPLATKTEASGQTDILLIERKDS